MKTLWRGFLQSEGIHLPTYIPIEEGIRNVVTIGILILHTIQTINKAFEVFISIVNLHNQNNLEIFASTMEFR